jgi:hypothetical protein
MPNNAPYGYQSPSVAVTTPANPTAPNSTSAYQCQGLGGLLTPITPAANVLINLMATLLDAATTVGEGVNLQLAYGPMVAGVAAPTVNTALPAAGVLIGNPVAWESGVTLTTAADSKIPVCMSGLVKNLTQGQQYWFDVVAESITGASQVSLVNVTLNLIEIG